MKYYQKVNIPTTLLALSTHKEDGQKELNLKV
jgi:hypothetical protein